MIDLTDELNDLGKLIVDEYKDLVRKDKFVASGDLEESFKYDIDGDTVTISYLRYAEALFNGVKTRPDANKVSKKFRDSIIRWAKYRGMRPKNARNSKGRFVSITDNHWHSMATAIGIGIRRNGISKRFEYQGSGFELELRAKKLKKVTEAIQDAYLKGIKVNFKQIENGGINIS